MAIAGRSYTNTPIVSRGSLEDSTDFNSGTRSRVVSSQPARQFSTFPVTLVRNTLQDSPVLTTQGPQVVALPNDRRWYNTYPAIIIGNAAVPVVVSVSTPNPIVVTSQPPWPNTVQAFATRNTLQDPPVLTTPDPVVVASPNDSRWYRNQQATIVIGSQAPTIVSGSTPDPVVVIAPNDQRWYNVKLVQVIDNIQLGTTPVVTTTQPPVVTTKQPSALYQGGRILVVRSLVAPAGPVTRPPQHLGGTLSRYTVNGTVVRTTSVYNGTTSRRTIDGSVTVVDPYNATLDEWTMVEQDIVLAEFNDETIAASITQGGNPKDITGFTLEAYLKPARGTADTAPGVVKLSTATGEITITNASQGQANIVIAAADLLSTNDTYTFWRLDCIDTGSKRNTAIFGVVTITQL